MLFNMLYLLPNGTFLTSAFLTLFLRYLLLCWERQAFFLFLTMVILSCMVDWHLELLGPTPGSKSSQYSSERLTSLSSVL